MESAAFIVVGWSIVFAAVGIVIRHVQREWQRFERDREWQNAQMVDLISERACTAWQRNAPAACAYCGRPPERAADAGVACAGCGARYLRRG